MRETTVPGLYAAGDMASVPHNYMLGAFVNGGIAGETAADYCAEIDLPAHDAAEVAAEQERVLAPTRREDGLTAVRDRIQDPPPGQRLSAAAEGHRARSRSRRSASPRCARTWSSCVVARSARTDARARDPVDPRLRRYGGRVPRSTAPRAAGASITCASTIPRPTTTNWFCHTHATTRTRRGRIAHRKRAVAPYIVPIAADEMSTPTTICASRRRSRRNAEQERPTMPIATHRDQRSGRRRRREVHRRQGLHASASTSARSTCCAIDETKARPT